MELEFKTFDKILQIGKLYMSITQKIHGSNAQVCIFENKSGELDLVCGSRTRWITPDDDNYGFARFVYDNKQAFINFLGKGTHFGEWAGQGINAGEGLTEKTFCLFNWRRWTDRGLPPSTTVVPLLYTGVISLDAINQAMEKLKTEGSMLVPGYMKPEGIVIELDGRFYKNVFDDEEIQWKEKTKTIFFKNDVDVSHLLQPMRLEKLLSRDERYIRDYPDSLGAICRDYVADLEIENQFRSTNEDDLKAEKKSLGRQVFYFVKSIVSSLI